MILNMAFPPNIFHQNFATIFFTTKISTIFFPLSYQSKDEFLQFFFVQLYIFQDICVAYFFFFYCAVSPQLHCYILPIPKTWHKSLLLCSCPRSANQQILRVKYLFAKQPRILWSNINIYRVSQNKCSLYLFYRSNLTFLFLSPKENLSNVPTPVQWLKFN